MKLCNSICLLGLYIAGGYLPVLGGDWIPAIGDSWNYNLAKTELDFDVLLIDMDYAQRTIDTLHEEGIYVVCYISIGSWEEWREDAGNFPAEALGQPLSPPWEDELWLDVNNEDLRETMVARVQKASSMKCDGVEPDHMDNYEVRSTENVRTRGDEVALNANVACCGGPQSSKRLAVSCLYANMGTRGQVQVYSYSEESTGFDISETEQIVYNTWFADTVHDHGMVVGLKNNVELLTNMVNSSNFAMRREYDNIILLLLTWQ
ncbi:unnamed protein product [Ascophyllum nodosum]